MTIIIRYHPIDGYKLFDVARRRVVISRDVIVDKIKELQQLVTSYIKVVTSYSFENSNSTETLVVEARIEENVIRSTRKRGFP